MQTPLQNQNPPTIILVESLLFTILCSRKREIIDTMQISQTLITKRWSGNDCMLLVLFGQKTNFYPQLHKFPLRLCAARSSRFHKKTFADLMKDLLQTC